MVWGRDPNAGGSFETQAAAVAEFFAAEQDGFMLPEVLLEDGAGGGRQ
jgi:hypothetical protein